MSDSSYENNISIKIKNKNDYPDRLLKSLNKQRSTGFLCDVILKSNNHSFHAHKSVLASVSKYFHTTFSTPLAPHDEGPKMYELVLDEFSHEAVALFLDFVYTHEDVAVGDDFLIDSLLLGNFFQCKEFMDLLLVEDLRYIIDKDNVFELRKLLARITLCHESEKLGKLTELFICDHFEEIEESAKEKGVHLIRSNLSDKWPGDMLMGMPYQDKAVYLLDLSFAAEEIVKVREFVSVWGDYFNPQATIHDNVLYFICGNDELESLDLMKYDRCSRTFNCIHSWECSQFASISQKMDMCFEHLQCVGKDVYFVYSCYNGESCEYMIFNANIETKVVSQGYMVLDGFDSFDDIFCGPYLLKKRQQVPRFSKNQVMDQVIDLRAFNFDDPSNHTVEKIQLDTEIPADIPLDLDHMDRGPHKTKCIVFSGGFVYYVITFNGDGFVLKLNMERRLWVAVSRFSDPYRGAAGGICTSLDNQGPVMILQQNPRRISYLKDDGSLEHIMDVNEQFPENIINCTIPAYIF